MYKPRKNLSADQVLTISLLPIISVILEVSWLVSSRLFDFSV
jgi:hypothetical protein